MTDIPEKEWFSRFDKTIVLLRDPRDRLVSTLLFGLHNTDSKLLGERIAALEHKERDPTCVSLLDLATELFPGMDRNSIVNHLAREHSTFETFRERCGDNFVFRYESVLSGDFDPLSQYLGVSLGDCEPTLPEKHRYGVRRKSSGDWKNWLLEEDIQQLRPVFDSYLKSYGYGENWETSANPIIRSQDASEFVLNAHRCHNRMVAQGQYWRD